jgi:hypothetical protein
MRLFDGEADAPHLVLCNQTLCPHDEYDSLQVQG